MIRDNHQVFSAKCLRPIKKVPCVPKLTTKTRNNLERLKTKILVQNRRNEKSGMKFLEERIGNRRRKVCEEEDSFRFKTRRRNS